jgi:hypothetical protein
VIPVLLVLALAACDPTESGYDPYAECMEDADAECCANADCDGDDVCWFSYICSPTPDGGTACSGWTGDRACHPRCVDGSCANAALTCTPTEIFPGSDYGETVDLCL